MYEKKTCSATDDRLSESASQTGYMYALMNYYII